MYASGVVVTTSDATPAGRASDALRTQLPDIFPEFVFEFVGPEELVSEMAPHELLFRVLGAEVTRESDGETISEEVTFEMVQTVQAAVDKIVIAAKAKGINLTVARCVKAPPLRDGVPRAAAAMSNSSSTSSRARTWQF